MKTIIDALRTLGPGRYDMATLAETVGGSVSPMQVGIMSRKWHGTILDGMMVKRLVIGRKVLISWQNAIGEARADSATSPKPPTQ
jgi:hypothetical protein